MTDDDDLDDLKTAMIAATPAPDAARRAKNLARAQEVFAREQQISKPSAPSIWQRLRVPSGGWVGLSTGAAAFAAVVILVQPIDTPLGPSLEPLSAPRATAPAAFSDDAGIEGRSAVTVMEEALPAPSEMAETAIAEVAPTARAAMVDPIQRLQDSLFSGRLPAAGEIDAIALINALAPNLGVRPPIRYAVPWSDSIVLRDTGQRNDPTRFVLTPLDDSATAAEQFEPLAPAEIRFVIAVAGFAVLLEKGVPDLEGWTFADALAMARASRMASAQALDLMEATVGAARENR